MAAATSMPTLHFAALSSPSYSPFEQSGFNFGGGAAAAAADAAEECLQCRSKNNLGSFCGDCGVKWGSKAR